jgi:hypothetical protein
MTQSKENAMIGKRAVAVLVVLGLTMVLLGGCGSKVSKSNYDKVTNGMTQAQVEKLLGEGTEKAGGGGAIGAIAGSGKVMTWTDGDKSITVTFVNGKVAMKAQQGL